MALGDTREPCSHEMILGIGAKGGSGRIAVCSDGPTVLIGLNASLKSVIARTFLFTLELSLEDKESQVKRMYLPDSLEPTLATFDIEHIFRISDNLLSEGFLLDYVPDSRIITRSFLQLLPGIRDLIETVDSALTSDDALTEAIKNDILSRIDGLVDRMGVRFIGNYLELKQSALMSYFITLRSILEGVAEEAASELGIDVEELLPLDVEISRVSDSMGIGWNVKVIDRRLGKIVPTDSVSTSVSSFLLMNYIMFLVANADYKNKIVVVEEPEQAMAPPQQVIFARFLSRIYDFLREHEELGNLFMIITTHSPYIGLGIKKGRQYYVSLKKGGKIEVLEGRPGLTFIMADLLRLRYIGAEGGEE